MKVAVLGTGVVGKSIATKMIKLGHHVMMGSRTSGNEKAREWVTLNGVRASEGTFKDAAAFGEMIFLCLSGVGTMDALRAAGEKIFSEKTVVDITNPLDFSKGMPPTLFVSGTDSLGEMVQRALPDSLVVKTLNTVNCEVMVNPAMIPGEPDMLLCGNNKEAKLQVADLLRQFGWKNIIDLGGIECSRLTEANVLLWVNLMQKIGHPYFASKYLMK